MKTEATAKLLTVYINSTDHYHSQPLYEAIVQLCKKQGIAGATVMRCAEGYGGSGHLHTSRLLEMSENLPVRIEIVDSEERIESLMALLDPMIGEGLLTMQDVFIRRYLHDPKP
jgi:PII-like signaling protein